jgi:hypothetical protein
LSTNGSNPLHPLATILPLFPCRLQFPIPVGPNLLLMPGKHVHWGDVADRAVQTNVAVMFYVILDQTLRIFEQKRRPGRMLGDELQSIVGNDPWFIPPIPLFGPFPKISVPRRWAAP